MWPQSAWIWGVRWQQIRTQIKRTAVKENIPAVLFEITRRHSAGCVGVWLLEWGRAGCDKLIGSLMEMFAWALDGWAPLVFCRSLKEFPICVYQDHSSRCLMWPFWLFNTWVHYDRWAVRRMGGRRAAPLNGIFNFTGLLISHCSCDCVTVKRNQGFWKHIKQKAINQHTVVNFCINTSTAGPDCFLIFISTPAVLSPTRTLKRICP